MKAQPDLTQVEKDKLEIDPDLLCAAYFIFQGWTTDALSRLMRTPMKWFIPHLMVFLLSASVFARGTADLINDAATRELLAKKCIRLGTSEVLPIQFKTACRMLSQPHLLKAAQKEYSKDGEVSIPIVGTALGNYYYISESGHRTEMIELYRGQTDAYSFDYIVKASGKRFFGRYDVIIHLQVIDASATGVVYSVSVHAYPHNGATRFLARRLGVVNRYFKKKTRIISYIAREIGIGLCEQEEMNLNWPTYGLNSGPVSATILLHE